jgi:hypothetical protein
MSIDVDDSASLRQTDHLAIMSERIQEFDLSQCQAISLREYGDVKRWKHCCMDLKRLGGDDLYRVASMRLDRKKALGAQSYLISKSAQTRR